MHQLTNLNHKPIYVWLRFKLCFQIFQIDVFFLCKQNILVPSIGEEENMIGIEFVCGWRIMSLIHNLVFNEEINAGISLPVMNIDQNIDCYCFVFYSWEHGFLGSLKLVEFFFLGGLMENTLLPNKCKYNNAKSAWEKRQWCIQIYCT